MLVLGLETSCDETGVALYDSERGLLADALFSQIDLHRAYGGVVPELASRDHVRRCCPLILQVLAEAVSAYRTEIDAIAYTAGPGLVGVLLVGAFLRSRHWLACGHSGARRAPHGRSFAGADAGVTTAGIPVRRFVGVGRSYAAGSGRRRSVSTRS